MRAKRCFGAVLFLFALNFFLASHASETPYELRVGVAGHAFDHLGAIGEQAEAAAACGSTILYTSGFGGIGYEGLPEAAALEQSRSGIRAYVRRAKSSGIKLAIGYVCATSIVKLDGFDRNWDQRFRKQFSSPPAQWLQQDTDGNPLKSWYGGDYRPACMNHPDWRRYEKFIVRLQLEAGHDGVFFDNPTVHPQGCYCEYCLKKFSDYLKREGAGKALPATNSLELLRQLARSRTNDFLRFRSTIGRDFLADIRQYARTIKPHALVTCNNSLNSPRAFFSQSRIYGYNIMELSQAEDWVTVEDMETQPRAMPNGKLIEYGPVYSLLRAISHRKPVVACTIAEADYHTPPNLTRLAMAEAAAHEASYLCWPTWPEAERARMIKAIRPQADLLRENEKLLNATTARRDALLFLPFRQWQAGDHCAALGIAAALSKANIQFDVLCEEQFELVNLKAGPVLLLESLSVLNDKERAVLNRFERNGGQVIAVDKCQDFCAEVNRISPGSIQITAPKSVRAVVRDQPKRTIVHLLNLNIQKLSSFQDQVSVAEDLRLNCRVPFSGVRLVRALTADQNGTRGTLSFSAKRSKKDTLVEVSLPRLEVSTILVIEH